MRSQKCWQQEEWDFLALEWACLLSGDITQMTETIADTKIAMLSTGQKIHELRRFTKIKFK